MLNVLNCINCELINQYHHSETSVRFFIQFVS
jgi:hypothetical protein